jgi:hypothetical protein
VIGLFLIFAQVQELAAAAPAGKDNEAHNYYSTPASYSLKDHCPSLDPNHFRYVGSSHYPKKKSNDQTSWFDHDRYSYRDYHEVPQPVAAALERQLVVQVP